MAIWCPGDSPGDCAGSAIAATNITLPPVDPIGNHFGWFAFQSQLVTCIAGCAPSAGWIKIA